MSKQIITKTCGSCNRTKPISEYYKHRTNCDKHYNDCKVCHIEKMTKRQWILRQTIAGKELTRKISRNYRKTTRGKNNKKRYRQNHPEQTKSRSAVAYAITKGILEPIKTLFCSLCPNQAEHYHHHKGYAPKNRLVVSPICTNCHKNLPK